MAITNINKTLDFLKSQAVNVISKGLNIRYPHIKKELDLYVKSGGSNFRSLIGLFNFNKEVLSSSTVNSVYLLAYLDFYAIYTVLYANYDVFKNLQNVSRNKYSYVYDLYKELSSLLATKELLQENSYARYENFMFSKNIDELLSGYIVRGEGVSRPLGMNPALTLPVRSNKTIIPAYITATDYDNSISESTSNITNDGVSFSLLRLQNGKIGTARGNKAKGMVTGLGYSIDPEISGTIFGYFSDSIYVTVVDLDLAENGDITDIWITCSTNGNNWSTPYAITPGAKEKILIEDQIEIGLYIILYNGYELATGDKWVIDILSSSIDPPTLRMKAGFDTLEKISFIKYMDLSSYPLNRLESIIDRDKFGDEIRTAEVYDSRIGNIVVSHGTADEYIATFEQKDYDITSNDTKLVFKYDFRIDGIEAHINAYYPHGATVMKGMEVENISTVTMSSTEILPDYGVHTIESPAPPKVSVEYNIIAEDAVGRVIIPALPSGFAENNPDLYAWDFVIPRAIDENQGSTTYWGTAYYEPRFPVSWDIDPAPERKAYMIFEGIENAGLVYDTEQGFYALTDYIYTQSHILWYPVLVHSVEDIIDINLTDKWIKASSSIYYLYYRDEDNSVRIALRNYNINEDQLNPFTGKVYGHIEMRSSDQPNITPFVFDYSVSCI